MVCASSLRAYSKNKPHCDFPLKRVQILNLLLQRINTVNVVVVAAVEHPARLQNKLPAPALYNVHHVYDTQSLL